MIASNLSGSFAGSRLPAVREAVILVSLAWLVPFLVHLVPWSGPRPLGVYVLPMFWVTFVGVYFYGGAVGAVTGLVAPLVNLLVTGLPAGRPFAQSAVELVVFALVAAWSVGRVPRLFLVAPLAYVVARMAWVLGVVASDSEIRSAGLAAVSEPLARTFTNGWSGMVILLGINLALIRLFPTDRSKKTPAAV